MQYNYANALTNIGDGFTRDTALVRSYEDPKEKIVNEQDQDITINSEDDKNDTDEKLVAFEEGLKNDEARIDESKKTKKLSSAKNK